MEFLDLDLSADRAENRILGEERTLLLETDRLFVPAMGCFYHKDLVIRNAANGQILTPIEDYSLYELVLPLAKSNAPFIAYSIIHVHNRNIQKVNFDYRAVGGEYQITGENAEALLGSYLLNASDTYPWGNVFNVPVLLPPELHLEDVSDTYDAGTLTLVLGRIADAVRYGDPLAMSGMVIYMNSVADQYLADATGLIEGLDSRLTNLLTSHEKREGDYIITDSEDNPSNRFGGFWSKQPNILLRGAGTGDTIGDLTPIATGTGDPLAMSGGVNARYTNIWQKGQDLGQITYMLSASATSINEGDVVTITLTTIGLPAGQLVPYRITGTSGFAAADITPTPLIGNFTVNGSGIGTINITASEDMLTEGSESFTLALTNGNVTGAQVTVAINDTSKSPALGLKFSANSNGAGSITQVNEGSTAYLVVVVNNLSLPHTLTLTNTGTIADADLADPRPTSLIVDVSPKIVPYSFLNDMTTEGNQTLTVAASSATFTTPVSKTLTVKDTSLSPSYSLYFSGAANGSGTITSRDEGLPFYLVLVTSNVAAGEVFDLVYTGNAVADDFTQARPISLTIGNDGKAIVPYTTTLDNLTDGQKTMGVLVQDTGNTVASGEIVINDTSQNPAYTAFWSSNNTGTTQITQVNEGSNFYLWVSTSGIAAGTPLTVEYSGSVNGADLIDARPTTLTIGSNGSGSILYTSKNDFAAEGLEFMTATIKNGAVIVATTTIEFVDTSVNSTYQLSYSSDAAGSQPITTVNEGQTFYLQIVTTNVPSGTALALTYSGTASNADFNQNRLTTTTVDAQGRASAIFVLKNDFVVEGAETLISTVSRAGNSVGNASINIVDSSTPTISARYSASSQGTGTITSVNEDVTFYLVLTTKGYQNGKVLNLAVSAGSTDLQTQPPATVTLSVTDVTANTNTIVNLKTLKDYLTEGNETLTIQIKDTNNTTVLTTASITVNDTSKTPTFNSYWSGDPQGTSTITSSGASGTVYLVTNTTNLSNGELLSASFGGTYDLDNLQTPPSTAAIAVSSGRVTRAIDLTQSTADFSAKFQANEGLGLPEITYAFEGDYVHLTIASTFADATPLYLSYGGSSTQVTDYSTFFGLVDLGDVPDVIYVNNDGSFSLELKIKEDLLTEGVETLSVSIYSDAGRTNLLRTVSLDIYDTSKDAEITINLSTNFTPDPGGGIATVHQQVVLSDIFEDVMGRAPLSTDRVHFVVPNGVKIISVIPRFALPLWTGTFGAIQVGTWPTGSKVRGTTMQGGMVMGMGGRGAQGSMTENFGATITPADHGGTCMNEGTNPDVKVIWTNYGTMCGGGGGGGLKIILGGYDDNTTGIADATNNQPPPDGEITFTQEPNRHITVRGGGGGAPYGPGGGRSNPINASPFREVTQATDRSAGLTLGGAGFNSWEPDNEGRGGNIGEAGNVGYLWYNTLDWPGTPFVTGRMYYWTTQPGQAGYLIDSAVDNLSNATPRKNNLSIINAGNGFTKGL